MGEMDAGSVELARPISNMAAAEAEARGAASSTALAAAIAATIRVAHNGLASGTRGRAVFWDCTSAVSPECDAAVEALFVRAVAFAVPIGPVAAAADTAAAVGGAGEAMDPDAAKFARRSCRMRTR
jgi:hypothetical protein